MTHSANQAVELAKRLFPEGAAFYAFSLIRT